MGVCVYTSKYVDNEIVSQARERLVPFLYESLLGHLRRLQGQIQQRDFEGRATSLDQAAVIVAELVTTVGQEPGESSGQQLDGLYHYLGREIQEVGILLDQGRLTKLIGMVASLHESWVIASRTRWPEESLPQGSLYGR